MEAPIPANALETTNPAPFLKKGPTSVHMVNHPTPTRNTNFLPCISASLPAKSRKQPKVKLYAADIHCKSVGRILRSISMVGRAILSSTDPIVDMIMLKVAIDAIPIRWAVDSRGFGMDGKEGDRERSFSLFPSKGTCCERSSTRSRVARPPTSPTVVPKVDAGGIGGSEAVALASTSAPPGIPL